MLFEKEKSVSFVGEDKTPEEETVEQEEPVGQEDKPEDKQEDTK